jgi:hypothetical protein
MVVCVCVCCALARKAVSSFIGALLSIGGLFNY